MFISDFTCDNLGKPDQYALKSNCNRVRIVEKDLTIETRARARIYLPVGAADYIELQPGEVSLSLRGNLAEWIPGTKAFAMETVNVDAAVFTVIEDIAG